MNAVTWIHVGGGLVALVAGAVAIAARKGGRVHALAGSGFFASMLVLGVTASILEPLKTPPESPLGGIMVCYFALTSWVAARWRDGTTGAFEIAACATVLLMAAAMVWGGFHGATTPVGPGPVFALGAVCALAGLLDLNAILRVRLSAVQRISRHLWRMCFAFFIGTGSFFLGQQDTMPAAVRGSPVLLVLAFAPFAVMAFWLVRVRVGKRLRGALQALGERPRGARPGAGNPGDRLVEEAAK